MKRIPQERLRLLRNKIPIDRLIENHLEIPFKRRDGYLRFLCPICEDFHTATNPQTNLARCFRCRENFNPIELVMTVGNLSFLDAVEYLERLMPPHCP